MSLPYRTRKFFGGLTTALLCLLLVAVIVWMVWIIWLDRFVVYSRDGAQFRFDSSVEHLSGEAVTPPAGDVEVSIFYDDGKSEVTVSTELAQLFGYYADTEALTADIGAVRSQIQNLTAGTPVMLDVKDIYGYFLYSTDIGPTAGGIDTAAMDDLIAYITSHDLYAIARVPAFSDYYFGLNQTSNGLFREDGYALWTDFRSGRLTYWLDPTKEGTLNYLTRIVSELKRMGFDEVVFTDFRYPDTDELQFTGDRSAAIAEAADTLATICTTETFCVSFEATSGSFPLPAEERTRLYLVDVPAARAQLEAAATGLEDPAARVVFLTELGDTRYDQYSVLRPLSSARTQTVPES